MAYKRIIFMSLFAAQLCASPFSERRMAVVVSYQPVVEHAARPIFSQLRTLPRFLWRNRAVRRATTLGIMGIGYMLLRRLQQARALVALPTTPPAPDTIPSNLADYPEFQFAVRTAELYNQLLHVLATEKVSLENEGKKIIDQLEALCTQYKHFVEKQDFSRNQKPFWKHWKIEKGLLSPTLSTITQNMTAYFEAFWLVGTVNLVCCRGPLPQTAVLDATTNTYFIGIPKDDVCEKILEQFFQKYRALYYDLFATINDMPTQRQERGTHHEPSHSSIN